MQRPSLGIRDRLFLIVLPVILFGVGLTLMLNVMFFQRAQRRIIARHPTLTNERIDNDPEIRNMAISALLISGGGSLLLYVVLFMVLERTMIRPLESLLKSARRIAEEKDFQARVSKGRNDEIGQLIDAFNTMAEELSKYYQELESSNQELVHFAYIASHDLQEPLRMVGCFVELLADRYQNKIDEKANEYIHFAVDGVSRMQRMIKGLMEYSRIQTQQAAVNDVYSRIALEEAINNLRRTIDENHGRIEYDPETMPVVQADLSQMIRLLQNLISNGIRFHRENTPPVIRIKAVCKGENAEFEVADNGIGIEKRHQEKIFILFQRLNSQEQYPGTGIGLAVCKRIVERQGGSIWLDSTPGKGTTFYFSIPRGGLKT